MHLSASRREDCSIDTLLVSVPCKAWSWVSSDSSVRSELLRASFWDLSSGSEAAFCVMSLCNVWVIDCESADKSASFSGLGGIGGAGMLADDEIGRLMSNGESRRFTGAGFGWGGGLGCTGGC